MTTVEKTTTGLVLTAVSLRFGDGDSTVLALDNVDLEVTVGELVAIDRGGIAVEGTLVDDGAAEVRQVGDVAVLQ